MSGGHWDYFLSGGGSHIESSLNKLINAFKFLVEVEQQLDWGHSGDSCLECARLRTLAGLDVLFDYRLEEIAPALAVMKCGTNEATICPRCLERDKAEVERKSAAEKRISVAKQTGAFFDALADGRSPTTSERSALDQIWDIYFEAQAKIQKLAPAGVRYELSLSGVKTVRTTLQNSLT